MSGRVKNKLRLLRRMNDLTQEQLAEALGVTRHTILAIENGKYEPSIALDGCIVQVLGGRVLKT
jgi:putative transcriptional regulator